MKAKTLDKRFDDGNSVLKHLDLARAKRVRKSWNEARAGKTVSLAALRRRLEGI